MYAQRRVLNGERPAQPSGVTNRPDMPNELWAIIQRAWRQQPSSRPTAGEVLLDLQGLVAGV